MREIICNGNELTAHAAIDAGCNFFGGYPITPSSEVAHEMSVLLPKKGGKFIQMEDEIAGVLVSIGASVSGAKAMTATSGPGMSLKSESFGLAFMYESPLVCIDVQRGGPSTGLPTRVGQGDILFARNPTFGDVKTIALAPGNLNEVYTETIRAFNFAERFMTPVILLLDETLGHLHAKAVLPDLADLKIESRKKFTGDPKSYKPYEVPADEPALLNPFFTGYPYHITGLHHGSTGFPTEDGALCQKLIDRLINKIESKKGEIESNERFMLDDAEICVIAFGSASLAVKEAILSTRKEGVKAGLFRPITLWPSPEKAIIEIAAKFKKLLVVELNMGQYALEVERIAKRDFARLNQANGRPIEPKTIAAKLKEMA
ncbi:MAG: 2-oxoglutarate synthase subunit alpha [Helicobacteraceae bacterium]|jgi:2-oxoglutarate ferredoxin oxidoreductase subunit alpha|nr:2-oxoglutarate synthase subunit alpha [Helicobacteraceae bacterium]